MATWLASVLHRAHAWQLWTTLALAPLFLFPVHPLTELGVVGLLVLTMARRTATGRFWPATAMTFPSLFILGMAVLGAWVAPDPARSWVRLSNIIIGVALFLAAADHPWSPRQLYGFGVALMGAGLFSGAVGILGGRWEAGALIVPLPQVYDRIPVLITGLPGAVKAPEELIYPRLTGGALTLLLPVSLAIAFFGRNRGYRSAAVVAALVMGAMLLLTQTLSGIAGVGLVGAIFLAMKWRPLAFAVPLTLLGGWVAFQVSGASVDAARLFEPTGRIGLSLLQRLEMWRWALDALRDAPLTGIGLNALPSYFQTFYSQYFRTAMPLPDPLPHAHQLFLHTALDLGLPGLGALLLLLIGFARTVGRASTASTGDQRALLVGVAGGVAAYLVFSTVDLIVIGGKPLLALWAMLGLSGALAQHGPAGPALRWSFLPRWGLVLAATGTLTLTVLLAPMLTAMLHLNAGTLMAHRVLHEARESQRADEGLVRSAQERLRTAQSGGVAGRHTEVLLAALDHLQTRP